MIFAICFHKAKIQYEANIAPFYPDINKETQAVTTLEDIAKGNYIHTPTVVFRRNMLTLPKWFKDAYPGDCPLHILNATYGKIKFLSEEMAVYRVHSGGVHSMTDGKKNAIKGIPLHKFLGEELISRGFSQLGKDFFKRYSNSIVYVYGLNAYEDSSLSKRSMAYTLLLHGNWKMKLCCFFPFFLGSKTNRVYKNMSDSINFLFRKDN